MCSATSAIVTAMVSSPCVDMGSFGASLLPTRMKNMKQNLAGAPGSLATEAS